MQVGCGAYELEIKGRRFLYFWHYESRDGRRRQVKEYLGSASSAEARSEGAQRCAAYYDRMVEELARMRRRTLASIGARA